MKSSYIVLIVIGVFVILIGGCGCNGFNSLVMGDQLVRKAWGDVETNYQRRNDLYSSIVKTIEGSAHFEQSTLKAVIEARANATQVKVDINDPATLAKYQAAQGQLQSSFGRLFALAEAYPDLKTTKSFQDFQAQIEGTENRINISRQDYNTAVNTYNLQVATFPNNILSGIFHYNQKPYYQADAGTEKNPDIHFNLN